MVDGGGWARLWYGAAALSAVAACGSEVTVREEGPTAGSGAAASASSSVSGTGGSMCNGCTAPGLCSEPPDRCACPCAEGEWIMRDGEQYVCRGGCYAPGPPFPNACGDMTVIIAAPGTGGGAALPSSCPGSYGASYFAGPTADYSSGKGPGPADLTVQGCDAQGRELKLHFQTASPSPYPLSGSSIYSDGQTTWQLAAGSATLSLEGMVGELIEGAYDATFDPGTLQLSGTFRVCHVPDIALP